jgi:hypothetical protein
MYDFCDSSCSSTMVNVQALLFALLPAFNDHPNRVRWSVCILVTILVAFQKKWPFF